MSEEEIKSWIQKSDTRELQRYKTRCIKSVYRINWC